MSMKSFNAEYRIMIIWQPEKMNSDAANRLLKLIEEPYPKTLFLLVAESSEFILPTILSRTQLVKVSRIGDSELTDPLKAADEERDKLYASLRDTIKAYAKFPIAETAQHAEPLLRVVRNYKIKTTENYMKESGLVDNMLQDLFQYRTQLRRLGLEIIADRLKAANDRVRQLLAERNDQRSAQIMGELKAAREATDRAYLTLVRLTNAYALLNPDRAEAFDRIFPPKQKLKLPGQLV